MSSAAMFVGQPTRARTRDWLALAVLQIPVLLVAIDNTVLSFALPAISADLLPTANALMWIVDSYALMLAGLLIAMGFLGDRLGRRRLLLIGSIGFGLASLLAAFATSAGMLIVARVALGIAGATLMPTTLSLIRNIFTDRNQRRIAIATWAASFSGGAAMGPLVGGYLLEHYWWGSVFLINVPLIVLLLVLALLTIEESRDPMPGPVDMYSVLLILSTMFSLVYAIKKVARGSFSDLVLGLIIITVLSALAFYRRQIAVQHPMVDVTLFRNKVFSGSILVNLLSFMGLTGYLFFGAQYLQLVLNLSPMEASRILVPGLIATVISGFLVVRIAKNVSVRMIVTVALVLSTIGFAATTFVSPATGAGLIAVAFAVLGVGIGFAETLTNDVILSTVPANRAGAASAISETAYEIGAVLGTAVLGSVLLSVYRNNLVVPEVIGFDDPARETLGGAVATAERFPNIVGQELLLSAHHAFTSGVVVTAFVGVGLSIAAALIAWTMLADADQV